MSVLEEIRAGIERLGWSETARRSGINRTSLHRRFRTGGNPKLSTIEAVTGVLGLALSLRKDEQ